MLGGSEESPRETEGLVGEQDVPEGSRRVSVCTVAPSPEGSTRTSLRIKMSSSFTPTLSKVITGPRRSFRLLVLLPSSDQDFGVRRSDSWVPGGHRGKVGSDPGKGESRIIFIRRRRREKFCGGIRNLGAVGGG